MKRIDLLRRLEEEGCVLVRSRGGHDIYRNVITGATQPVPRHRRFAHAADDDHRRRGYAFLTLFFLQARGLRPVAARKASRKFVE